MPLIIPPPPTAAIIQSKSSTCKYEHTLGISIRTLYRVPYMGTFRGRIFGKKLARKSLLVIDCETNVMKFLGKSAGYADGPLVFSLDL